MVFLGAKYCSHCGSSLSRVEQGTRNKRCPRCAKPMSAVVIGNAELSECPKCLGLWATTEAVERICADREQELLRLGRAAAMPAQNAVELEKKIRYLPCPVCSKLMNRVNFARCSSVVVDVCKQHGTWFDRDELRRIVEFVRAGGLDAARARERTELEEARRRLRVERERLPAASVSWPAGPAQGEWEEGLSAAARALRRLLRR